MHSRTDTHNIWELLGHHSTFVPQTKNLSMQGKETAEDKVLFTEFCWPALQNLGVEIQKVQRDKKTRMAMIYSLISCWKYFDIMLVEMFL